jgi:hypothetical protein
MVPPVSRGIRKKKKWTIVYLNIPSALLPVPHGEGISVPEHPKEFIIDSDDEDEDKSTSVLLNRRRLLNLTSSTAGLLRHSHTFSHSE